MGKEFGNLDTIRGVTFFRLSPFEQKAFGGMIKDGVPNMVRRFNGSVLRVAPCKFHLLIGSGLVNGESHCSVRL